MVEDDKKVINLSDSSSPLANGSCLSGKEKFRVRTKLNAIATKSPKHKIALRYIW